MDKSRRRHLAGLTLVALIALILTGYAQIGALIALVGIALIFLSDCKEECGCRSAGAGAPRLMQEDFDPALAGAREQFIDPDPMPFADPTPPRPPALVSGSTTDADEPGAPPQGGAYPGAVDEDELTAGSEGGHGQNLPDAVWDGGASDRILYKDPAEGNPFNLGRAWAPAAGPACTDDDAYAGLDADESMAIQGYSRNDHTRVVAGTMQRLPLVKKAVEEELEEREDLPWWGRDEY